MNAHIQMTHIGRSSVTSKFSTQYPKQGMMTEQVRIAAYSLAKWMQEHPLHGNCFLLEPQGLLLLPSPPPFSMCLPFACPCTLLFCPVFPQLSYPLFSALPTTVKPQRAKLLPEQWPLQIMWLPFSRPCSRALQNNVSVNDRQHIRSLTGLVSARTWTPLREYCVWWSQETLMSSDRIIWIINSITIFKCIYIFNLIVRTQLHVLNCVRQCRKFLYQQYMQCDCLSFTSTSTPIPDTSTLLQFWVMSSSPTQKSPSAPSFRLLPSVSLLNVIKTFSHLPSCLYGFKRHGARL